MKSSANGQCIDSMEQPIGRDVELNHCHGQGRNQVNCLIYTFWQIFLKIECLPIVRFHK